MDWRRKTLEIERKFLIRFPDDDRRFDAAEWKGDNILGFALMEVREMLKKMESSGGTEV